MEISGRLCLPSCGWFWPYLYWDWHYMDLSWGPTDRYPWPYFLTDFPADLCFAYFSSFPSFTIFLLSFQLTLPFLFSSFTYHLWSPLLSHSLSHSNTLKPFIFSFLFLLPCPMLPGSMTNLSLFLVQGRSHTNAMWRDARGNSPVPMSSTDTRGGIAGSDPTYVLNATGILHDRITWSSIRESIDNTRPWLQTHQNKRKWVQLKDSLY